MADVEWHLKGRNFAHCNCAYGCPCQFNALPTHGNCEAIAGIVIDEGNHGSTKLDGLMFAGVFSWPGPIHEGQGQAVPIVDERASPAQREAILRIMSGQDTEPGATFFQVFSSTLEKVHDPVFAKIDLDIDVAARKARFSVPGVVEARGEPIINPVTKKEHRARFDMPEGFEFTLAEVGRGWAKTSGAIELNLADSHAHFAELNITGTGVIR
ncbi:MAG TPA: DUF1326 domain-containing protein [Methylocella sp.]|jgi:hypothetical protein